MVEEIRNKMSSAEIIVELIEKKTVAYSLVIKKEPFHKPGDENLLVYMAFKEKF